MYAFIAFFQANAVSLGYSATSLTDFITWFNGLRNALASNTPLTGSTPTSDASRQQLALDLLGNAAYLVAKGKHSMLVDRIVREVLILNLNTNTSNFGAPQAFVTNVSGSSLPATAFITAELAKFDQIVTENSQSSNTGVNTLQTLA